MFQITDLGRQSIWSEHKDNMARIITIDQVKKLSESMRGKSLVVTGGCFDLLHIGHITLLENAKKQGDILIVLLESDESIKKRKGINRPIHSQNDRAKLVGALKAVDIVILLPKEMTNDTYDTLIKEIHPSVIATTDNDPSIIHKERQAKLVGAKVIAVNNYLPSVSTSKLLDILSKEI